MNTTKILMITFALLSSGLYYGTTFASNQTHSDKTTSMGLLYSDTDRFSVSSSDLSATNNSSSEKNEIDTSKNQNRIEKPDLIRINISNGEGAGNDETVIYFSRGATDGFDADYDAHKISGEGLYISSYAASGTGKDDMAINGISDLGNFCIPFKITGRNNICTMTISQYVNTKARALYIYDKVAGKYSIIEEGASYNFSGITSVSLGQFFITSTMVNTITGVTEYKPDLRNALITPNPYYTGPLIVQLTGFDPGTATIEIFDSKGMIIKTIVNNGNISGDILHVNIQTEVYNLPSGTYIVKCKSQTANSQQKLVVLK